MKTITHPLLRVGDAVYDKRDAKREVARLVSWSTPAHNGSRKWVLRYSDGMAISVWESDIRSAPTEESK